MTVVVQAGLGGAPVDVIAGRVAISKLEAAIRVQYTPSEGLKLVDVSGSGGVSVGGEVLEGSAKFLYSPGQVSFDVQPSSSTKAKLEAVTAGLRNKVA